MTTKPDLLALASQLETAGDGSRELDIKIALVAEPYPRRVGLWLSLEAGLPAHCAFTRSIDAALTLAPKATPWQVTTLGGPEARVGGSRGGRGRRPSPSPRRPCARAPRRQAGRHRPTPEMLRDAGRCHAGQHSLVSQADGRPRGVNPTSAEGQVGPHGESRS